MHTIKIYRHCKSPAEKFNSRTQSLTTCARGLQSNVNMVLSVMVTQFVLRLCLLMVPALQQVSFLNMDSYLAATHRLCDLIAYACICTCFRKPPQLPAFHMPLLVPVQLL